MNRIWANRLEAGTQLWADVPESRKNAVDAILRQDVADGVITAERYTEITGKEYEDEEAIYAEAGRILMGVIE